MILIVSLPSASGERLLMRFVSSVVRCKIQCFCYFENYSKTNHLFLLCLLGAFTVSTKLESQEIGCRLNFGSNGSITSKTQIARTTGTTVIVTNLFEALPVRRGEFIRSIKKQYQKMIKVLQSYAIIAVGVRILVTNTGKVCMFCNIHHLTFNTHMIMRRIRDTFHYLS